MEREKFLVGDFVVISKAVALICERLEIKNNVNYKEIGTAGMISKNEEEVNGTISCRVSTIYHGTLTLPVEALSHIVNAKPETISVEKIKLPKAFIKTLRCHSTIITTSSQNEYHFLPFWIKGPDEDGLCEMFLLGDNLPEDLSEAITNYLPNTAFRLYAQTYPEKK